MTGFIDEFRDFILDRTDTSPDWAEAIGTSLCSTAIGSEKRLVTLMGAIKLNVFYIMIGPSGIASKSVPINQFARPILTEYNELVGYDMNMDPPQTCMFPGHFSIEGILQYLSNPDTIHNGILMRDEFTNMFADSQKQYMGGIIEFLSELYDGHLNARYTRSTKLEKPTNVYASILAATTPYIYKVMTTDFFVQGTGNRVLWVLWDKEVRRKTYQSPHDFFGMHKDEERKIWCKDMAKKLVKIQESKVITVHPGDEEAGKLWMEQENKWKDELTERFNENIYDLQQLYLGKIGQSALKLAGIHVFSRNVDKLPNIPDHVTTLPLEVEDMEWGLSRANKHVDYFQELLEQWRTRPIHTEVRSLDEQVQYVKDRITDSKDGLTWSALRQNVKWEKRMWLEVLSQLYDTKELVGVVYTPKIGRPGIKFYDTGRKPKNSMAIPWETLVHSLKLR